MSQMIQWNDDVQQGATAGAAQGGLASQQPTLMPQQDQVPADGSGDMPTMLDQGVANMGDLDLEGGWFDTAVGVEADWAVTPSKVVTVENMSERWDDPGDDAVALRTWGARVRAFFGSIMSAFGTGPATS